jgi:hypothetical protein
MLGVLACVSLPFEVLHWQLHSNGFGLEALMLATYQICVILLPFDAVRHCTSALQVSARLQLLSKLHHMQVLGMHTCKCWDAAVHGLHQLLLLSVQSSSDADVGVWLMG